MAHPHRHLFVDISSHGFGHLAQTAPVLNRLAALRPGLRLTLRTALPPEKLAQRIAAPFELIATASDFGYRMIDALTIDGPATAAAYRAAHADFSAQVEAEASLFRRLGIDVVFANVSYLPLAGAARAGLPAAALCSLNWADLFDHFFGREPWAATIHAEMIKAYRAATFLRTTPGMPMTELERVIGIGPIATIGNARRAELREKVGRPLAAEGAPRSGGAEQRPAAVARHGPRDEPPPEGGGWPASGMRDAGSEAAATASASTVASPQAGPLLHVSAAPSDTARIVLVALGGIPTRLPVDDWPTLANTHWLVPAAWQVAHPDMSAFEPLGWPFADLLASVDAVVTKPGYGTFAEAACNGTAVLYQRRGDWPEQDCLIEWLGKNTRAREITGDELRRGALGAALDEVIAAAVPPVPAPDGIEQAARHLATLLQ